MCWFTAEDDWCVDWQWLRFCIRTLAGSFFPRHETKRKKCQFQNVLTLKSFYITTVKYKISLNGTLPQWHRFCWLEQNPCHDCKGSAKLSLIRLILCWFEKAQLSSGRREGYPLGMYCLLVPKIRVLSLLLFLEWLWFGLWAPTLQTFSAHQSLINFEKKIENFVLFEEATAIAESCSDLEEDPYRRNLRSVGWLMLLLTLRLQPKARSRRRGAEALYCLDSNCCNQQMLNFELKTLRCMPRTRKWKES